MLRNRVWATFTFLFRLILVVVVAAAAAAAVAVVLFFERSYPTLDLVSTGMGDRLLAGIPSRYVTAN